MQLRCGTPLAPPDTTPSRLVSINKCVTHLYTPPDLWFSLFPFSLFWLLPAAKSHNSHFTLQHFFLWLPPSSSHRAISINSLSPRWDLTVRFNPGRNSYCGEWMVSLYRGLIFSKIAVSWLWFDKKTRCKRQTESRSSTLVMRSFSGKNKACYYRLKKKEMIVTWRVINQWSYLYTDAGFCFEFAVWELKIFDYKKTLY